MAGFLQQSPQPLDISLLMQALSGGMPSAPMSPPSPVQPGGFLDTLKQSFGMPPAQGAPAPAAPAAPANPASPIISGLTPSRPAIRAPMTAGSPSFNIPLATTGDVFSSKILSPNGPEGTGKNPRSSASGPGQFIDSTFRQFLAAQHPELAGATDSELPGLKNKLGAEAVPWLKGENAKALAGKNIPVNDTTLYGAHFLGSEGLSKLWSAPDNAPVATVLDRKAIEANPEVLSGKTVGEVKAWLGQKMNPIPQQPLMGAPPGYNAPAPTDFSGVRAGFDKGIPNANAQTNAVLQGLAGGAASVDATKPGSFAAALAAAGAGGARGYGEADKDYRQANMQRAAAEMPILSQEHQQQKDIADAAYLNAKNQWDVTVKNQLTSYENEIKGRDALMPKISHDANGITIQQYDPATNSVGVKFVPTKPVMEQFEKLESLGKALGMNHPLIQMYGAQLAMQGAQGNPVAQHEILKQMTVNDVLRQGAGSAVFGPAYEQAMKAAAKQMNTELGAAATSMQATKPGEYNQALNERVGSILLGQPWMHNQADKWLKLAKPFSPVFSGLLLGNSTLSGEETK